MIDATNDGMAPLSPREAQETGGGRSALPPITIGLPVPPVCIPLPPLLPVFSASWWVG